MEIKILRLKRYDSPDSKTKAFINLALDNKAAGYIIYIENMTVKQITKDGKEKLIVTMPSYKTGELYRDIVAIKGQLWWDICNTILEEYCSTREVKEEVKIEVA